ncbi:hypothetical protein [Streptomyces sp. NBC_00102]|uniref:hypothetical protein n=1 Tax=Streptomyces sp. NBC_00102 TaxID=2975652 RepID=UPI00225157F0|nr:hypothetical protein [Streptomyces sp. NBC_00102]MCX5397839.1 hypothetical protein [Streptomyces sp. NBC_00102]
MSASVHPTSPRSRAVPSPSRRQQDRSRGGGLPGNSAQRALLSIQSSAGNRAATVMVQRARQEAGERPEKAPAQANTSSRSQRYRARIAAGLDKLKKNFEFIDTFVKGIQTPTNAGFAQHASATADETLKHSAAGSGAGGSGVGVASEFFGAVTNGKEGRKAWQSMAKNTEGAAHHTAKKKFVSKTSDAVVSAGSALNNVLAFTKELTKAEKLAAAANASEASGISASITGGAKGGRAAIRSATTLRKYRALGALEKPDRVDDEDLTRLKQAQYDAELALARAYVELDSLWQGDNEDGLAEVPAAIDSALSAMGGARDAADQFQQAEDKNTMNTVLTYARDKQKNKMGKQVVTAVGESAKAAGGIVTAVAATAGAAGLASNPVGWGIAATAAGLIFGVAAYKGVRAGTKRYDGARHPERWAEDGETSKAAASREEALKESLKFWKKVSNGERQAMARKLYALAAGPDIEGSSHTTTEMRDSARSLLIVLKAGPTQQKLDPEAWAVSLNDPGKSAAWVKEIAEQLSSA